MFTEKSKSSEYIAYDFLENKKNYSQDIVINGEKLLNCIENNKEVSTPILDKILKEFSFEFDPKAFKNLEEVCKYNIFDGATEEFDYKLENSYYTNRIAAGETGDMTS